MDESRSSEEPEVLDTRPGGPGRPVWVAIIAICCCLIVIGLVWRVTGHDRAGTAVTPTPSAVDHPGGSDGTSASVKAPSNRSRRVADLAWLRATADYDIFLRTTTGVIRIRPNADRIVQTTVPGLASSGPVSFQPVDNGVLIRPLDVVAGYRVPDGGLTQELSNSGGVALPGPDGGHIWVEDNGGGLRLVAAGDARRRAGARITLPSGVSSGQLSGDGHGYVLGTSGDVPGMSDNGHTVYRLRPGTAKKLPIGRPIAVGPTRLLGVAAGCTSSCAVTELGSDFAKTTHQPRWKVDVDSSAIGAMSPDGRTAAIIGRDQVPHLVDVDSGKQTRARLLKAAGTDQMAFSPDGRWLFGVGEGGHAYAVDVATGRTRPLLSDVVGVQQLAVRG